MLSGWVTRGGDIEYEEGKITHEPGATEPAKLASPVTLSPGPPVTSSSSWVVAQDEFGAGIVGGKSNSLNGLRGRLPDWIRLPPSLALPFGAFQRALEDDGNRELRGQYAALVAAAEQDSL